MEVNKKKKIKEYVEILIKKIDSKIQIKFDKSKPDGTPRKIVDSSLARKYGWKPKISLSEGLNKTLESFFKKINKL